MRNWLLAGAAAALWLLHQDFWFWDAARPLVFGFLPVGLFYHAAYSLAAAALMWALVRFAWPARLEAGAEPGEAASDPPGGVRRGVPPGGPAVPAADSDPPAGTGEGA